MMNILPTIKIYDRFMITILFATLMQPIVHFYRMNFSVIDKAFHVFFFIFISIQESNNLTNCSSFRYNGLVHKKTVGIVPATEKKGFTVVLKTKKNQVSVLLQQLISHIYAIVQNDASNN